MFIVNNNLPYYINEDRTKIFPCEIDGFSYKVYFEKPLSAPTHISSIMTYEEIKKRFNVVIVDGWDKVKDIPKKVSNKKVSSYIMSSNSNKDSL